MTATLNDSYKALGNLNLWFKNQSGDTLQLTDVPSILPLRWTYFQTSWEFLKPTVLAKVPTYTNPDFLKQQIDDFSAFIASQRNSTTNINPFSDAIIINKYYAVFDNIDINSLPLSNEENRIVRAAIAVVAGYSKNDFIKIKNTLRDYRDRYADTVSLSDPTYNIAYNRSSIPAQITATIIDEQYMLNLQQGIKSCDFVLANFFASDSVVDPFALARTNANNPLINIGQYSSGRLVKLNYGEDLQSLAFRYLGDANRWIDIAIANGLQPPYIDEIGTQIPLLTNGSGNQINLAGTSAAGRLNTDSVFLNQILHIKSNTQVAPDQRQVVSLRQIPVSNEIILGLDGPPNLSIYQTADNAYIRVFAPNTVNSNLYVLIPSNDPITSSRKDETPWFLTNAADDIKLQKVDLAVSDSGDLIFAPNGDLSFSFGLDNAVQAIKFKIQTEVGSLRYHPNYGIVNIMGRANNDVATVKALISDSIVTQIEADPRFERVENINVTYNNLGAGASYVSISLSVRLAGGGNKVVPISFTVTI